MRLAVIGVPTNSSGTTDGVARAPAALRAAGLIDRLNQTCDVLDFGDVQFSAPQPIRSNSSGIIAEESLVSMIAAVKEAVTNALKNRRLPLVMGGDCPLLIGCLAAALDYHTNVGLLFIDGHEDAYPPHKSPTGEAADMEVGMLLKQSGNLPKELNKLIPALLPSDMVLLGTRDAKILQHHKVESIRRLVETYDDQALIVQGAGAVAARVVDKLLMTHRRLWLHVDLDVLSTREFPAVDYRQGGGITWPQLTAICKKAIGSKRLAGWNVTIYNPDLDHNGTCAEKIINHIVDVVSHLA